MKYQKELSGEGKELKLYQSQISKTILKNDFIRRVISIVILILIWHIFSYFINDKNLFPSPLDVGKSIQYHSQNGLFFHVGVTLFRVFVSFFLAMFIGSAIGIVMGRKKTLDD